MKLCNHILEVLNKKKIIDERKFYRDLSDKDKEIYDEYWKRLEILLAGIEGPLNGIKKINKSKYIDSSTPESVNNSLKYIVQSIKDIQKDWVKPFTKFIK